MGNTLESPVTEKKTCSGKIPGTDQTYFGLSSCQGWRISNEDNFFCLPQLSINLQSQTQNKVSDAKESDVLLTDHAIFGVFDGHGGPFAAEFASKCFYNILCRQEKFVEYCLKYLNLENKGGQRREGRKQKKNHRKNNHLKHSASNRSASSDIAVNAKTWDEGMIEILQVALRTAFLEVDRQMLLEMIQKMDKPQEQKDDETSGNHEINQGYSLFDSGTAAIVILITPTHIICANAGDCRSILCRRCESATDTNCNTVIPLSFDHKPDDPEEKSRIIRAGGVVSSNKVDGLLALSRALGDFSFKENGSVLGEVRSFTPDRADCPSPGDSLKIFDADTNCSEGLCTKPEDQKVSPAPDFVVIERESANDLSIIAACDGIWDVLSNNECSRTISQIFHEGETALNLVAEEVIDVCLKRGSRDNMTVLIVKFPSQPIGKGGGVKKRRKHRQVLEAEKSIRNKKSHF